LSTDIIVGHPGETEEEFQGTKDLLAEIRFDKVHIAAYSARPGTRAGTMEEDPAMAIADGMKQFRRIELERQQEIVATERSARLHDQIVEVLVEGESKGKWRGRTTGNVLVFFASPDDWRGKLALVHITATSPWSLQGTVCGEVVPA
jgi:tRNA-2-methylthio-N6-dimethylallyladenosine synthase